MLTIVSASRGQITPPAIDGQLDLVGNPQVLALRAKVDASFNEIRKKQSWKPYDSTYTSSLHTAIWLKFGLKNPTEDTLKIFLQSDDNYVTIYQNKGGRFKEYKNGHLFPLSERANKKEYFFTELRLAPEQSTTIYIRLYSLNTLGGARYVHLYSEKSHAMAMLNIIDKQSGPLGFIYFYIIALITIFSFAVVFWLRLLKSIYLYYLGYLFFLLIYGFQVLRTTVAPVGNFLEHIPLLSHIAFQPVQFTFIGFYVFFILHLLKVKRYDELLAKILQYLGLGCFAYAIFNFVFSFYFSGLQFAETLFVVVRAIILPLNFVLIFWIIYKVRHPLLGYFIVGQSFFFIGAVLGSYLGLTGIYLDRDSTFHFVQAPNIIFQMGLLAEVFCFSLALGKNIFLLQREKEFTNAQLIHQLQQNKELQEGMNRELDRKVNEKTDELIQLYSEIEREKEEKIKRDFATKLRETEMIALRTQMNPHFLFNSLSAIKHLIMKNRNDDAMVYLDDFSSLLRGILQNSRHKKITVEEELEILELYLSLEKNRMGAGFEYDIQVTDREALSQFNIPPLLLQPFVENAIWHGLQPSLKSKKKLSIIFDTSEFLTITIQDNGIGRKASAQKKKLHDSMGTTLAQDRLTLYNHISEETILLRITDLEKGNTPLGTKITLTYQY